MSDSAAKKLSNFTPFDLSQLDRVEAVSDRGMDRLDDVMAKAIAKKLFYFLGTPVDLNKQSVESKSLAKIEPALDQNKCLVFFKLKPFSHRLILAIDAPLAERLLDLACGSDLSIDKKLTPVKPKDLEDANIASSVLKNVMAKILEAIEDSWKKYYPVDLAVSSFHVLEKYAQHDIPDLQVRKLNLSIGFGDGAAANETFQLSLLVPEGFISALLRKESQSTVASLQDDENPLQEQVRPKIGKVEVEVRAVLGEASLTIEEILGLKAGDVIELGSTSDDPIEVLVNSKKKFKATVGIVGGKRAIKIIS